MLPSFLGVAMLLCSSCLEQVVGNRVLVTDCRIQELDNGDTLTCDYPWDLNQTQLSFCVYRMTGDNKDNRERVLSCNWFGGETICKTENGFSPPEIVSNVFTVALPKSGAEAYCCDIYPSERTTNVKKCRHEQKDL
ncbi:uncharacterized protein [Littorina saxatilis]|uniref:uncharacterized protein n=1 Tax=Littorina saxatilis TaxID=31220 RepID=UPI0038B44A43